VHLCVSRDAHNEHLRLAFNGRSFLRTRRGSKTRYRLLHVVGPEEKLHNSKNTLLNMWRSSPITWLLFRSEEQWH